MVVFFEIVSDIVALSTNRCCLPFVGCPRRVRLVEACGPVFDTTDEQCDAERASTTGLGELLDVVGDGLGERFDVDRLAVPELVDLRLFSGKIDERAGVSDVAGTRDPNVVVDLV